MPVYDHPFNFLEQQNALNAMVASTWLNTGAETLLEAQAEILGSFKSTLTEWIDRRHAAIQDTKRLFAQLRESHETDSVMRAYQQWAEQSLERMAADVAGFYSALMVMGQIGRQAGERQSAATEAAAVNVAVPRFAQNRVGRPIRA